MANESDWLDKLKFMRDGDVEEAEWSEAGVLMYAKLGPDRTKKHAPSKVDPSELAAAGRRELLGATSRLVPGLKRDGQ